MFKVDTHVHTAESSWCGRTPAAEMVAIYRDAGYDAIVICDHYFDGFFHMEPDLEWAGQTDRFLAGYRAAAEGGARLGLKVWMGIELRLQGSVNDYLVFGLDEAFLCANPRLYKLPLWEVRDLCERAEAAVVQAHPFRPAMVRVDPALLHGAEVINGHPIHDGDNRAAFEWAREKGLRMTAGSDAHFPEGAARAWMGFGRELVNGADLARAIRDGEALEMRGPGGVLEATPVAR